jgi:hypothetical protein
MGRTQRPDIWAHRSRMGSAEEKSLGGLVLVLALAYANAYTYHQDDDGLRWL